MIITPETLTSIADNLVKAAGDIEQLEAEARANAGQCTKTAELDPAQVLNYLTFFGNL